MANFTPASTMVLNTQIIPTVVENAPIVGEQSLHTIDDFKRQRIGTVVFELAKRVYQDYYCVNNLDNGDQDTPIWIFPKLLPVIRQWLDHCVVCHDNTFPQLLLLQELKQEAAEKIHRAIARTLEGDKVIKPRLQPYDPIGFTGHVLFDTTRPTWQTRADKCHISHVVADTDTWEQKMAQTLEDMPEVLAYVKNHNVGFTIPYTLNGETHAYYPDFLVRYDDGHGDPLNLIVEVTGRTRKDKEAKVETAETLWIPAVNNHGGLGRWHFIQIDDPWDAQHAIRKAVGKGELA